MIVIVHAWLMRVGW